MFTLQAATLTVLAICYVFFLIKDTRGPWAENNHEQSFDCLGAFSIQNVVDVFKTCFKKRDHYIRSIFILLLLATLSWLATVVPGGSLVYLFTILKFHWTAQKYTVWVAVTNLATSFATFAAMAVLSYKMKIHDALIGVVGAFFGGVVNLIQAFAIYPWMFYLSKSHVCRRYQILH